MLVNNAYVNRNPEYVGVEVQIGIVPTIVAVVPLVYHVPTVYVTGSILTVLYSNAIKKKDSTLNSHFVLAIVLHQFSTFCFMLTDYLTYRIPVTGILTEWCASQDPGHLIKVIFWATTYFFLLTNDFPFLMAVLRLVLTYYPTTCDKINRNIIRFSIPFILFSPFAFTWILFPALGVCRQAPSPFSFGSIYLHFIDSWHGLKVFAWSFVNCIFMCIASIIANAILYRELRRLGTNQRQSKRLQKAELTLTLTSISMLICYLSHTIFLVMFGFFPAYTPYVSMLRSFASDLDTVAIPWIFFLVHPAFREHTNSFKKCLFGAMPSKVEARRGATF
ncbi:unnamed protein product [Caenorhabditis sp. 36 PRJEB53466]|nr:unnamed protein product [Caenorhabditis sp. 36 PRJEB53466]